MYINIISNHTLRLNGTKNCLFELIFIVGGNDTVSFPSITGIILQLSGVYPGGYINDIAFWLSEGKTLWRIDKGLLRKLSNLF